MSELHTVPVDAVSVRAEAEGDGRTLELRLLPWDTVATTADGRELFRPGAFEGVDPGEVRVESMRHGGALVGRGTALDQRADAPYLTARISRTHDGDDLLELVNDGTLRSASIVFADVPGGSRRRPDGVMERSRVDLRRVAILERGAYEGAGVIAVREAPEMPDATIEVTGPVVEAPPQTPPGEAAASERLNERMDRIDSRLAAIATLGIAPLAPLHYRAQSLGELLYVTALEDNTLNRALADQITADNPGIVPPGVASQIRNIINLGRRTVDAFGGGRALPETGMSVTWPRMTAPADLSTIYAAQSAEKAAIVSAKVSFGSGSSTVVTYAGGSDVSKALIRRSSPPYLELYAQAMLAAWAKVTNLAFLTAVTTAATGVEVYDPATDTDGSKFVAALVNASVKVEAATGSPATFAEIGTATFGKLAGILAKSSVNPTNVSGTVTAAGLRMNVSGIDVIHEPGLGAAIGFVSNEIAAGWLEDPVGAPAQIRVEDAEKIGDNVAYWNLGAPATFIPAGVVEFSATLRASAKKEES